MAALYSALQELLGVDARIWGTGSQLGSEPGRVEFRRGPQAGGFGDLPPPPEELSPPGWDSPLPRPIREWKLGWQGRSPEGPASLPREQEAEPRPADLLLEVRGLGRPSRPHFLQPRPTPCGPRVYGNSGLDGFCEIIAPSALT